MGKGGTRHMCEKRERRGTQIGPGSGLIPSTLAKTDGRPQMITYLSGSRGMEGCCRRGGGTILEVEELAGHPAQSHEGDEAGAAKEGFVGEQQLKVGQPQEHLHKERPEADAEQLEEDGGPVTLPLMSGAHLLLVPAGVHGGPRRGIECAGVQCGPCLG